MNEARGLIGGAKLRRFAHVRLTKSDGRGNKDTKSARRLVLQYCVKYLVLCVGLVNIR